MAKADAQIQRLNRGASRDRQPESGVNMTMRVSMAIAAIAVASVLAAPRAATFAAEAVPAAASAPASGTFTLETVEINGVKFWMPSTIVVHQGDKVTLKLNSVVPGPVNQHGFALPGYNIQEVVTRGVPKTVTFVADKVGEFPYYCQLHAAHIGGQLVVLPKQ